MNVESIIQKVLHLRQVEGLSQRQIAQNMGIGRKRVRNILYGHEEEAKSLPKKCIIDEYAHLISHWYSEYPRLRATQIYSRLQEYGYTGSYPTVARSSRKFRRPKVKAYHTLHFLPGEEAQIDWFFYNDTKLGQVAGFLYVLSYSRYAWGIFYPKTSFEFFLAGHIASFNHIGGLAHRHRYDNIKSVVIKRHPRIEYNARFMDFSRFYGFSIHLCNPYKGNEKGRVERLIRDIRVFLYPSTFTDIGDLNNKFHEWLNDRNNKIHRSTGKTPKELLKKERLIALPQNSYLPRRIIPAFASKTALVEFETNKYSLPSTCASKGVELIAYPERIEICLNGQKVATHKRSFKKKQTYQNPLHAEKLLKTTPHYKSQRILQLITDMDPSFAQFLRQQDDETEQMAAAQQLFSLLKTHSRNMITSAVRELNNMRCYKIKTLRSLLNLPAPKDGKQVWPKNSDLLNLKYQTRRLEDYDDTSTNI